MDTKLLITFIILNIFNVIIQTVKSLATVKCGKSVASVVNAIAYGLYTIVTVYMLCDLDLWLKALIVALCNLVGVFVVKFFEEKAIIENTYPDIFRVKSEEKETNACYKYKDILEELKINKNKQLAQTNIF